MNEDRIGYIELNSLETEKEYTHKFYIHENNFKFRAIKSDISKDIYSYRYTIKANKNESDNVYVYLYLPYSLLMINTTTVTEDDLNSRVQNTELKEVLNNFEEDTKEEVWKTLKEEYLIYRT